MLNAARKIDVDRKSAETWLSYLRKEISKTRFEQDACNQRSLSPL